MNEPVNKRVDRMMKRTRSKVRLYDALAILEGGGQPALDHNAHALEYGASLLRKGQVQTSEAALWATEGKLARENWPPPRLELWKRALTAYMGSTPELAYRDGIYRKRTERIKQSVGKILTEHREGGMEKIHKRVGRILKQGTEADRLEENLRTEESLEIYDINEDVTGIPSQGWGVLADGIADNIEFTLKREGYTPASVKATIEEILLAEEEPARVSDTVLASWSAHFPDGSNAGGNAVIDGVWQPDIETYTIVSLTFGGKDLRYFGL